MSHHSILGPDGTIARRLQQYEERPQQLAMADAVADAIAARKHLMVEAGTGVGKSFAYLVPAMLAAAEHDLKIVVSTHTISLQEQLFRKDIPFLQEVLPKPVPAVLVKGRSNYLSLRRLRVAQQRAGSLLTDDSQAEQLVQLGRWSRRTQDGSRSDLDFQPLPAVWDLAESDSDNCLGTRCGDYGKCFYYKARKQMNGAKLFVVNHALFFSDLAVRRANEGHGILPKYQIAILDEAHTLEDVAAEHLGLQISRGQVERLLNRLFVERRNRAQGLLTIHGDHESLVQHQRARNAADELFYALQAYRTEQLARLTNPRSAAAPPEALRIRQPTIVANPLSEPLFALAKDMERLIEKLKSDEEKIELVAAAKRCADLGSSLQTWLGQTLAGQVYWLEVGGERQQRIALASAPIAVGPTLRSHLYDEVPSVILTSATLSTGGPRGFEMFQERLGLADAPTQQLGSPFDYRAQAELHLFRQMPDPVAAGTAYEAAVRDKIKEYVLRTGGRAFVLFTSVQMMQRSANLLRSWFGQQRLPLLCQNEGMPRTQMVEEFRRAGNAVLFGVDSFWQGVDVPGDALGNVILTKLPFTAPDRPLTEARNEAIQARGGEPFQELTVPQAIIKLKQGFGRLIRTRSDRGIVVILDPRILAKGYGRRFLEALPECRRFIDGVAV